MPAHHGVRRTPIDPSLWTGDLVRELLVVVYGGHREGEGWALDVAAVARRRRVSPRTVRRWAQPGQHVSAIPAPVLRSILDRRRPRAATLERELLAAQQNDRVRERAQLGRGRGNLAEYGERGWLSPHKVFVVEEPKRPLRRVVVVRDEASLVRRALGSAVAIDVMIADGRHAAELARHDLLVQVQPWRLEAPARGSRRQYLSQTWLASAPLPVTPVEVTLVRD